MEINREFFFYKAKNNIIDFKNAYFRIFTAYSSTDKELKKIMIFKRYIQSYNTLSKTARTLLSILGAYFVLLLMDYSGDHQHQYTLCIFKSITGIPCPGCGMGRGTLAIFEGNFAEAFSYNILCIPFTFAVFCAIIWLVYDLMNSKDTFFKTINRPVKPLYLLPFFIIATISWAVNIIRGI